MNINYYLDYARHMNCNEDVLLWITNVVSKNITESTQTEIEHILDYMASDYRPARISKMSFEQAKNNTEKWNKSLQKKGKDISEIENIDFDVVLDFYDGFKIVKLVSENSFKKEGFLMRHCVASYFGKDTEIFSLRDKDNIPHCTIEKNMQIKGKANGEVSVKYVKYIVDFLTKYGISVGDNEMSNLGYINVEKIAHLLSDDYDLFDKKYLAKKDLFNLKNKENETFFTQEFDVIFDNKIIFDLSKIEKYCDEIIASTRNSSGDYTQNASSGDRTQNASSGDSTQNASSGDYTQNASSGNCTQNASSGNCTQNASSGNRTQNASSGNCTQNASSGNCTQNASSGYRTQNASSGYRTQNASSGDYTQNASSGDRTRNASSGGRTRSYLYGKNSITADIGINSSSGGCVGTWITLAEYNNDNSVVCVKSAQIDGVILKEGVLYTLKNKEFIEAENQELPKV